jgi:purine catabolism regulator
MLTVETKEGSVQLHDLLSNPGLAIRLRTASSGIRLRRAVTTVAPTELIDPCAYLEGNELVTLAGIAMNFEDPRTWDAYVERLAAVSIAGIVFNSGVVHSMVPDGLVGAGDKFDIPVFEVAHPVNLLQVHRLVNDALHAEGSALLRTSLQLADRCAELEAVGTTVLELLQQIREVLDGEVGLVDGQGRLVASQPPSMSWEPCASRSRLAEGEVSEHVRHLNSVRGRGRFSIVVRSPLSVSTLDALLGPVGSIVSLHLNSTAEQYTVENDRILALIEQMRQPRGDTLRQTKKLVRAAGFDASEPTIVVTTRTGPDCHDAWRMRLQFADVFPVLGVAESEDYVFLIGQGFGDGRTTTKEVIQRLKESAPRRPAIVTASLPDLQSLRTAMLASPLQLLRVSEPVIGRGFDISSVLATALTSGGVDQAINFLRPLDVYDKTADYELMRTLRAYLDADGSPSKTAAALFIHRNSLLYRLNRISELLGISLRTLEGKTACAVALAIWDMQKATAEISGATAADAPAALR